MAKKTGLYIVIWIAALLFVAKSKAASLSVVGGSNQLTDLHPNLVTLAQQTAAQAQSRLPNGVTLVIDSTYRTFDQQAAVYAQGRTAPGDIVSNAQPGHSYHNYGLAIDFYLTVNGDASYNVDNNWMTVVNTFKGAGFEWGGDWTSFKDNGHVQMTYGYGTDDLLSLYNNGNFITSPYNGNNYVDLTQA